MNARVHMSPLPQACHHFAQSALMSFMALPSAHMSSSRGNASFAAGMVLVRCTFNRYSGHLRRRPNNSFKPSPLRGSTPKLEFVGRVGLIQLLGR